MYRREDVQPFTADPWSRFKHCFCAYQSHRDGCPMGRFIRPCNDFDGNIPRQAEKKQSLFSRARDSGAEALR